MLEESLAEIRDLIDADELGRIVMWRATRTVSFRID